MRTIDQRRNRGRIVREADALESPATRREGVGEHTVRSRENRVRPDARHAQPTLLAIERHVVAASLAPKPDAASGASTTWTMRRAGAGLSESNRLSYRGRGSEHSGTVPSCFLR